jgi:hypothetical protein
MLSIVLNQLDWTWNSSFSNSANESSSTVQSIWERSFGLLFSNEEIKRYCHCQEKEELRKAHQGAGCGMDSLPMKITREAFQMPKGHRGRICMNMHSLSLYSFYSPRLFVHWLCSELTVSISNILLSRIGVGFTILNEPTQLSP